MEIFRATFLVILKVNMEHFRYGENKLSVGYRIQDIEIALPAADHCPHGSLYMFKLTDTYFIFF